MTRRNGEVIESPSMDESKRRIPLAAKIVYTAFMVVLVPVYLRDYGPTNFLYFCDVALFLTLAGIWMESALLIGMCSVGILFPQTLWLLDFGAGVIGLKLTGMTGYMFDPNLPLFTRGLSLFHGWLPILLVWLVIRLGYDKRAHLAWTGLAAVLVLVAYLVLPPAGAGLSPNTPVNVNYVYGFNDREPQQWMNQNLYVVLWMCALWLVAFLPTHLVLRKFCRTAHL